MIAPFTQVLIIHPPGRKRVNLTVLLGSILPTAQIHLADDLNDGAETLRGNQSKLVFMGSGISKEETGTDLNNLYQMNPQAKVFLMLSHPQGTNPFRDFQADGILYDGFSPVALERMLGQLKLPDRTDRIGGEK